MDREVSTVINQEQCIGCGLCVSVCPLETITIKNNKAFVTGDESLNCGHCMAVCPVLSINVKSINKDTALFKTVSIDNQWLPPGEYDKEKLVKLMMSRRSCRNYKDTHVNREILEDLVKIGVTAPSGTNSQKWTFTILPTRKEVTETGQQVLNFFKKLNFVANISFLRNFLKLIGKKELDNYYKEYYESIKQGIEEWQKTGKDKLFHGATSVIIVASKPGASCPAEDAMLATQNILLAAHSMGLGTCLIGFVVEAMRQDKNIKKFVNIPENEEVYSVIAIGYPNEKYQRTIARKSFTIRYFEESDNKYKLRR